MTRGLWQIGLAIAIWGLTAAWDASSIGYAQNKDKKPAEPPPPVPVRNQAIARVNPNSRPMVVASAARIDRLVEANFTKHKVKPNDMTTDEQFLRRVFIDINGAIPNLKQVKIFAATKDSDKRARVIDALLNTEGYASNFYNYWGDILRLSDRGNNNFYSRGYNEWVKASLEKNTPYNEWVFSMLAADGKLYEHPETGYLQRDAGMPLDAINNTVRIFLGTQIGCAQCHDHPSDVWTQKEFYEMAAFTFGTQSRRGGRDKIYGDGKKDVIRDLREGLKKIDEKYDGGGRYNRILGSNVLDVHDSKNSLRLPKDYQYDNGKPGDTIKPKVIFGTNPVLGPDDSPRKAFAKWLTSPENPRFTKAIANRLWKRLMGAGLIEPEDDIKNDSEAENPELMAFLTNEMVRVNYDMKEYLRILMNTRAYQRTASRKEIIPGEEYHFPGPILRRMTAEQVWDSFITLAVFDPDTYQQEPASVETKVMNIDLKTVTPEEVMKRTKDINSDEIRKSRDQRKKDHVYNKDNREVMLVRAAELPLPAPPSHFLRQFGQSDHEQISVSSRDGSVPQVLQMFNGPITHMLLEPKSLMANNVLAEKGIPERIDVIFLSILARKPTSEEREAAVQEIKQYENAGYGNVIWSLVNTREFLFIQ